MIDDWPYNMSPLLFTLYSIYPDCSIIYHQYYKNPYYIILTLATNHARPNNTAQCNILHVLCIPTDIYYIDNMS